MDIKSQENWKREALDMAFEALASCPRLKEQLVFKGARVLAVHFGGGHRASFDLDANLLMDFILRDRDRNEQSTWLQEMIHEALTTYTESQDPVRYKVESVQVKHNPKEEHPLGWNAFEVKVKLWDSRHGTMKGLPAITFDIASPESLGEKAIVSLCIGEGTVFAYTVERIAGEKMRAFLSSLNTYREKLSRPGKSVRAKDIYDIACIVERYPLEDRQFWSAAGSEFSLACGSRYIDCIGIATFEEQIDVTRATYEADALIPKDLDFERAWEAIKSIVARWEEEGFLPFEHPLPPSNKGEP